MKNLLLVIVALIALAAPSVKAEGKMELEPNDTIRSVLARQLGKPVELRLKSGEKIAGKVEKVTDKLAYLAQLTDADFYDAAVEIESIAAVVVRARSN